MKRVKKIRRNWRYRIDRRKTMLPNPNLMLAQQVIEERQAEARLYARQRQLLNAGSVQPSKRRLFWTWLWPLRRQPVAPNCPPDLAAA
jgi:hypothetical protein